MDKSRPLSPQPLDAFRSANKRRWFANERRWFALIWTLSLPNLYY